MNKIKKMLFGIYMLIKSCFLHEKPAQKRVLEKININKPFKKKNACRTKKIAKRK